MPDPLTVWRVVRHRYARSAFDGEGARRVGGRFNSKGTPVVYTADSLALSLLEIMVHVPSYTQLSGRVALSATFDAAHVEALAANDLPADWRAAPPARSTQRIGDRFVREAHALVLRVPSVIVPHAFNYLLNPEHPAFDQVDISDPEDLAIDPRLIK